MKKLLLAATMLGATLVGAQAADLPRRTAPLPPAPAIAYSPASAFSWTGFYAGASVGYGIMDKFNGGATVLGNVQLADPHGGVVIGPQVGFNYQVSPMFVAGVEADIAATTYGGGVVARNTPIVGTLRGRLGVTPFNPSTLIYVTGGFAASSFNIGPTPAPVIPRISHIGMGWTVGGGVEYAVNDAWSVKAEYLYTNMGANFMLARNVTREQRVSSHIFRVGVNYHFHSYSAGSAPVIARY